MDDRLIAAIQPYEIQTPWGVKIIRPPSVREALTILASYKGALEDAPVDTGVFFETLSGWLPKDMVETMRRSDRATTIEWVFTLVNAGVPKFHEVSNQDYESDGGWTAVVTDFVSVYHYTVEDAMNEKWPVFLMLAAGISQVRARQALEALRVKGIQYSEKGDREMAVDELMRTANYPRLTEEARQRQKDEKQARDLKALSARFAAHNTANIGKA